ncbi:hypothetical protein BaRGS_00005811 [Batillaria attramentaria]|uniref:Uncharacterized protein n=1 Tax=Batillaria attramentaria TaxID=370345 RepID=A0ABD0LTQ6_9CAEN
MPGCFDTYRHHTMGRRAGLGRWSVIACPPQCPSRPIPAPPPVTHTPLTSGEPPASLHRARGRAICAETVHPASLGARVYLCGTF